MEEHQATPPASALGSHGVTSRELPVFVPAERTAVARPKTQDRARDSPCVFRPLDSLSFPGPRSPLPGSVRSRMSRQLSQLLTPDLPAGATTQFGGGPPQTGGPQPGGPISGGPLSGGHLSSMAGLKSLLQHPVKGDPRVKSTAGVKALNRLGTMDTTDAAGQFN
ncbi:unnamed protein product [Merluccius merluccius]